MSESRETTAAIIGEQLPPIIRAEPARKFHGDPRGKIHVKSTQPRAFGLNTNEWNAISAEALTEHQEAHGLTDKEMARKIGCNDRTYENYRLGKCSPAGVNFLRAMSVVPELSSKVDEVCALQRDLDPRAAQAMNDMYTAAMKFADIHFAAKEESAA